MDTICFINDKREVTFDFGGPVDKLPQVLRSLADEVEKREIKEIEPLSTVFNVEWYDKKPPYRFFIRFKGKVSEETYG
jgi:hypothetical protein